MRQSGDVSRENTSLQNLNTFGIAASADVLVRLTSTQAVQEVASSAILRTPQGASRPSLVLGGGSNIVFEWRCGACRGAENGNSRHGLGGRNGQALDCAGRGGVRWHDLVEWTLQQGWGGLENLALDPRHRGRSPRAKHWGLRVELQDRFHSLDAVDLRTGQVFTLDAAQCAFAYRDSVFKHVPAQAGDFGLAGQAVITQVRLALPKQWQPELGYLELQRKAESLGIAQPSAQQVCDWVCAIRRAKLPDPAQIGNAGSFFKNPTVTQEQCRDTIAREPKIVYYPLPDGRIKLAAGWLIDACGWKGKTLGRAGVYEHQALVLVNRGTLGSCDNSVTGGEVMTLAAAIQTSVYERFGIRLEPEPIVV